MQTPAAHWASAAKRTKELPDWPGSEATPRTAQGLTSRRARALHSGGRRMREARRAGRRVREARRAGRRVREVRRAGRRVRTEACREPSLPEPAPGRVQLAASAQ